MTLSSTASSMSGQANFSMTTIFNISRKWRQARKACSTSCAAVYSKSPEHKARIVRSFVDGDYVILHVHIMNGVEAKNIAVMDIFRVENGKLMEHWDVASPVPETAKNVNGVF